MQLRAVLSSVLLLELVVSAQGQARHFTPERNAVAEAAQGTAGSPYIPLDSWIYPVALRLHDLGYLPTLYVGMLPYTRAALAHVLMLSRSDVQMDEIAFGKEDEAVEIVHRLARELAPELEGRSARQAFVHDEYVRIRAIGGLVLNDSFHVGQTFVNDYGRTYQNGINTILGGNAYATQGRLNVYVRGEYQHAPAAQGYSHALVNYFTSDDGLTTGYHSIIPQGTLATTNQFRLINASVSVHLLSHQIGFGRTDRWLGPARGGSLGWSNNAEPVYALFIDRVEPLYLPLLSRLTGPFRYEFFVGSLKGHDTPNSPWVHLEKVSFQPHPDVEFGFTRTVIWGGKDHVPITVGTFVRSFFSPAGVSSAVKFSRSDPGARFSTFDFNYRVPWRDHLFTLYTDSFVHDNVFPVSNPGRAAFRSGLLINRLPHLRRVDLRAEGVYTDLPDSNSVGGNFLYYEGVQRNGYTNRLFLLGDPIGREAKGGNAWLTWHRKPTQELQLEYRTVKAAKDLVPQGTTQHDAIVRFRVRSSRTLEIEGSMQEEFFKGPAVISGLRRGASATLGIRFYPRTKADLIEARWPILGW